MDSVRFGRALGTGARSAARALAGAVDAAAAPNPSPAKPRQAAAPSPGPSVTGPNAPGTIPDSRPKPDPTSRPVVTGHIAIAARTAARATWQAREARKGVARGGKLFRQAIWGPLAKISGVLWLEITGAFFGLFALFAGNAVWIHRVGLFSTTANRDARVRAFVFLAMALIFGYFCLSSFFRAHRRQQRD